MKLKQIVNSIIDYKTEIIGGIIIVGALITLLLFCFANFPQPLK